MSVQQPNKLSSLGSYVAIDVSQSLSYKILEHVPNGPSPHHEYGEGEIDDIL
jgi:hypothetical protein